MHAHRTARETMGVSPPSLCRNRALLGPVCNDQWGCLRRNRRRVQGLALIHGARFHVLIRSWDRPRLNASHSARFAPVFVLTVPSPRHGQVSFIVHLDKHLNAIVAEHGLKTYAILFAIVFAETARRLPVGDDFVTTASSVPFRRPLTCCFPNSRVWWSRPSFRATRSSLRLGPSAQWVRTPPPPPRAAVNTGMSC